MDESTFTSPLEKKNMPPKKARHELAPTPPIHQQIPAVERRADLCSVLKIVAMIPFATVLLAAATARGLVNARLPPELCMHSCVHAIGRRAIDRSANASRVPPCFSVVNDAPRDAAIILRKTLEPIVLAPRDPSTSKPADGGRAGGALHHLRRQSDLAVDPLGIPPRHPARPTEVRSTRISSSRLAASPIRQSVSLGPPPAPPADAPSNAASPQAESEAAGMETSGSAPWYLFLVLGCLLALLGLRLPGGSSASKASPNKIGGKKRSAPVRS